MPPPLTEPTPAMVPFLRAVREAPADDLPRLVFADWLDESGYATWAELTRVQCELDRLPDQVLRSECVTYGPDAIARRRAAGPDAEDARRLGLVEREWGCLQRRDELPQLTFARPGDSVYFERGLPGLRCKVKGKPPLAEALPGPADPRVAWLDTLYVQDATPSALLALADRLSGPMRWSFDLTLTHKTPLPYGRWPDALPLRRLRSLSLMLVRGPDPQGALGAVAGWPLDLMDELRLFVGSLKAPMIERLAAAAWPSLRNMRVANSGTTAAEVRLLAERMGPAFAGLEVGERNPVDAAALLALCRRGLFRGVDLLATSGGRLTDESVRALAECPAAANLQRLFLDGAGLTDEGLRLVIGSPHLRHVKLLSVGGNRVTDAGVEAAAALPGFSRIERLFLNDNPVGDAGARALAASPNAAGLYDLSLDDTGVTADGAVALAASPHLKGLTDLFLQNNGIGAEGRQRIRAHYSKGLYL